ncbi:MAG: DUF4317 domain-containing protein [Clostridiaceae bacterium]
MKHRDILEIKKRLKKDHCTISQMRGCYVNSEKNIVAEYRETFLNMEESEFFKYLEIAKKVLSGTLGNNLLELGFKKEVEGEPSIQAGLLQLKSSSLRDDGLVQGFYQSIIDTFHYQENYLILLFADAYDVMARTSDNLKLDESEETYEYIIGAICPVSLSDPGLHYKEDEKRIRAHHRDWMVDAPIQGFVYPAFSDRSSDVNSLLYYTKNPRETHVELMEDVLGCEPIKTTQMHRETIQSLLTEAVGFEEEKAQSLIIEFQESLNERVTEAANEDVEEPFLLTSASIQDILSQSHASIEVLNKIEEVYTDYFGEDLPQGDRILDNKVLKSAQQRKKEQALERQVENLMVKLEQVTEQANEEMAHGSSEETMENEASKLDYDVLLTVKPEKVSQIKSQIIDGQKCIIIPLEDNETATVNGQSGVV